MFVDKIANKSTDILLYGMTPPKCGTVADKLAAIAGRQMQRLSDMPLDALLLYDIQDEDTRTTVERPFPFMETVDAALYAEEYLADVAVDKIIYRAVGKYEKAELAAFLDKMSAERSATVFVGASSREQTVRLSMSAAHELRRTHNQHLLCGGVVIAERHLTKRDEHLRVFQKIDQGCSFFVSQGVYNVNASLDFLSDYYFHAQEQGRSLAPIIFTLTPCGSLKTLSFMKWLGISVPHWLENELQHARDILAYSVDHAEKCWRELKAFADEHGIPVGCNVESVAIRKQEVEASVELLHRVAKSMQSGS